ncbi:carboxymuconolactone decarboxylase family protein [Variovorax guangxiensis]|uniref:carboxymuconolactone decarboxylase family protein n=1 Tax=Variovorax guangxiensis TaxID=1775474 RepID=UPI002859D8DD|nr:carboxymuconolactone decarboxylase family protein [Variovorax guangxiensis]MDR6861540.1 4-carboxymuconolactone decarboxylase [Variovorax guangxiensis]
MARFELPTAAELTADQQQVCAEAIAGPRGKVPEPMIAWLRNPEFARRAQKVGELLRFDTTIEPHLTEMAILVCGRHWTAHLEWTAHKAKALKAGLDPKVIEDIAARRQPKLDDERARAVYDVAATLLSTGRLSETLYRRALAQLGERGLVELVGLLGYYSLVSLTLNAFELGLPASIAPELNDPDVVQPESPA